MRTAKKRTHIVLTIAEPLPMFGYHHRLDPQNERCGPFYSAGSKWYSFPSEINKIYVEKQAEALRARGYTATVTIEERS